MNDSPKEIINSTVRQCLNCEAEGYVIDTRMTNDGTIMRRRKCPNCDRRWKTEEIPWSRQK